ncbi:hypothetical protein GGS20DRAFT_568179 [Poronia punctata]|nr:hypothetical protein GGS20DRAFT_568179 [Poronia punctata]
MSKPSVVRPAQLGDGRIKAEPDQSDNEGSSTTTSPSVSGDTDAASTSDGALGHTCEHCPGCACIPNNIPSIPEANKNYMIRQAGTDLVISLIDGGIKLVAQGIYSGAWQWKCVEPSVGWLAFRNVVSGTYIGLDPWNDRVSPQGYSTTTDYGLFMLRPCMSGRFNLYGKDKNEDFLWLWLGKRHGEKGHSR